MIIEESNERNDMCIIIENDEKCNNENYWWNSQAMILLMILVKPKPGPDLIVGQRKADEALLKAYVMTWRSRWKPYWRRWTEFNWPVLKTQFCNAMTRPVVQ